MSGKTSDPTLSSAPVIQNTAGPWSKSVARVVTKQGKFDRILLPS